MEEKKLDETEVQAEKKDAEAGASATSKDAVSAENSPRRKLVAKRMHLRRL